MFLYPHRTINYDDRYVVFAARVERRGHQRFGRMRRKTEQDPGNFVIREHVGQPVRTQQNLFPVRNPQSLHVRDERDPTQSSSQRLGESVAAGSRRSSGAVKGIVYALLN